MGDGVILIYTPTWVLEDGTDAMQERCRASIEGQVIDGGFQWVIGRDNPYPIPDHRNVLHQYQAARELFLAGNYEALLTVEHDNALPDDRAVQRLIETPGDIVYAPYLLRHVQAVLNTWQYLPGTSNLGMPLEQYPDELERAKKAVIWRVCGTGMGCTLFRRHVLEVLPFHGDGGRQFCPDIPIAQDAAALGFESYANFSVLVDHFHEGNWLTPFKTPPMNQYIALQSVNCALRSGRHVRLEAGQPVDLTWDEARELSSVGFVEVVFDALPSDPPQPIERATLDAGAETATAAPDQPKAARKPRKTG